MVEHCDAVLIKLSAEHCERANWFKVGDEPRV